MSFHDATVPAFLQILGSLSGLLTKAEAHCKAKNIQPEVLLNARLYPDMYPLTRQIQTVCDFAGKTCARLTGSEVPSTPDTEKSFEELQQRIAKTVDYVKSFKPAQFDGGDTREVTFPDRPEQHHDDEGPAISRQFCVSEFLFPCRHRARHFAAQRRRDRQAGFSRGEVIVSRRRARRKPRRRQHQRKEASSRARFSRACRSYLAAKAVSGKMTGRAANWPSTLARPAR